MYYLTVIKIFSCLFPEKYFLSFVIPPFHLGAVIVLIIKKISVVELVVELGWNYMKFHPYSTHNSTLFNVLILKVITSQRWKCGITFRKIIFQRIMAEKLVTTQVGLSYSPMHNFPRCNQRE